MTNADSAILRPDFDDGDPSRAAATRADGSRKGFDGLRDLALLTNIAFRILQAVVLAHVLFIPLIGYVLGSANTSTVLVACVAVAGTCMTICAFVPRRFAGWAVMASLVMQSFMLVMMFEGHPWQVEMNFYYLTVVAMSATLCDFEVLFLTTAMVVMVTFVLDAYAPAYLYPGGSSLPRALLHQTILGFEALCFALISFTIRSALTSAQRSEERANAAARELRKASQNLSRELTVTSCRADTLDKALSGFRSETSKRLDKLGEASKALSRTAELFSEAAVRTTTQAVSAAAASTDVDLQVMRVAATYEDFHRGFNEIGAFAARSTRISAEAANQALATSTTINEAAVMSDRIDAILSLIAGVAGQTNLLALNATIEAARAGEHGRGFAVVAAEVKALAMQTTTAVASINEVMARIKESSARSVRAVDSVAATIGDLNAAALGIADAVQREMEAVASIDTGVRLAARNVSDVTRAIGEIRREADETGRGSHVLREAADEILVETDAIRRDVDAFTADLAA